MQSIHWEPEILYNCLLLSLLDGEKIENSNGKGAEFAAKTCMVRRRFGYGVPFEDRSLVTACKILGSNRELALERKLSLLFV